MYTLLISITEMTATGEGIYLQIMLQQYTIPPTGTIDIDQWWNICDKLVGNASGATVGKTIFGQAELFYCGADDVLMLVLNQLLRH